MTVRHYIYYVHIAPISKAKNGGKSLGTRVSDQLRSPKFLRVKAYVFDNKNT